MASTPMPFFPCAAQADRPGRRPASAPGPSPAPVIIVGAGPVGLAAALDLALHGISVTVLDQGEGVSVGSRAICWAKRSLEIFDRLGIGARMVEKGVTWKIGRLFHGHKEIYSFDLLPEPGHKMPAFINLQQYYVEQYLVERCADFPDLVDLRRCHKVVGLAMNAHGAQLSVETPHGPARFEAAYVLACDGARSDIRHMLGIDLAGDRFEEKFLIADVEMQADFPNERWFWFQPPFHKGQTALLHKQPDNIYRIDLQLGWDADIEAEKNPENVRPRLEKALGGRPFRLDWVSVYRFRCARLGRFVHGRTIFLGDSAHVVSPFGARGGNGGIQDADNLCWKLAAVLKGEAGPQLLESYDEERIHGAEENIRHSARATNFMSPPGDASRLFRDEMLRLAGTHRFARQLINSGRLSTPCTLRDMALQTPGDPKWRRRPGDPCIDAPLENGWLLERLGGDFAVLAIGARAPHTDVPVLSLPLEGEIARRYDRGVYLIRPDQHIAAAWEAPSGEDIIAALSRARGAPGMEAA